MFPLAASLVRLEGAMRRDQNDARLVTKSFIDRCSLAKDCEPTSGKDGGSEVPTFVRLLQEVFDNKKRAT